MKQLLLIFSFFALIACQPAPPSANSELSADQHLGKWLFINYWAQWCAPCKKEIPEFNEFAKQHKESVSVFAVNYDGIEGQQLREQAIELNIEFFILPRDPAAQLGYSRPIVLPTTIVIDPQGRIRNTLVGPQTEESLNNELKADTTHQLKLVDNDKE